MKTLMFIMADDTKWLEREDALDFVPYPGLCFDSLAGEQPLKISGASYDVIGKYFKVRLAWLSQEPLNSDTMLKFNVGWKVRAAD